MVAHLAAGHQGVIEERTHRTHPLLIFLCSLWSLCSASLWSGLLPLGSALPLLPSHLTPTIIYNNAYTTTGTVPTTTTGTVPATTRTVPTTTPAATVTTTSLAPFKQEAVPVPARQTGPPTPSHVKRHGGNRQLIMGELVHVRLDDLVTRKTPTRH